VLDPKCCKVSGGGVIRVHPVDGAQGTQTVVASGGHFVAPQGIAIAGNGDLFVSDDSCCGSHGVIRVQPVDGAQGTQTVVASGGHFVVPQGIAIALNGDVLVADRTCCGGNGGVIRVNPVDSGQSVVSSGGFFAEPFGIATQLPRALPPPGACGGGVPCACGDRVVSDRTLRGADPVTRTACPADGLVVAVGVSLDLGGATLRGQGAGVGVRIEAGATGVRVQRGKITGFATGVHGEGTTGVYLADVQVLDSGQDGVNLTDHRRARGHRSRRRDRPSAPGTVVDTQVTPALSMVPLLPLPDWPKKVVLAPSFSGQ